MKLQYVGLIGVGLIAALCAMVLLAWTQNNGAKTTSDMVDMVVATRDVPALTVVTSEMCEIKKVSRQLAPKVFVPEPTSVIGQVVVVPVLKGQPYTTQCFAPEGSGFHLASTLPDGKRAVTVALADYSVLEGLLYPGSTVDVIVSFDMRMKNEGKGGIISKTLLHGVQVLAVENKTVVSQNSAAEEVGSKGNENRRKVTLLVDPDQAEKLQLAMVHGVISLAMRKPNDKTEASDHITQLSDLGLPPEYFESPKPAPAPAPAEPPKAEAAKVDPPKADPPKEAAKEPEPAPPPPRVWTTTVIRGGQASTQTFPMPEDSKKK
jgi:pilus assembly protein CpaB